MTPKNRVASAHGSTGAEWAFFTIPFQNIASPDWVPDGGGLYSWHLSITPAMSEERFARVLGAISKASSTDRIELEAHGRFSTRYAGVLERTSAPAELPEPGDAASSLSSALMMLPIPLYVGMSLQLRRRLHQHRDRIVENMQSVSLPVVETSEVDTDEESIDFGRRVGAFLRGLELPARDVLYVRCLPVAKRDSSVQGYRTRLRSYESLLNSWHRPILGRR
jgi:hypothetical protein